MEDNISKIDELLHNVQCSIVAKYCYNKKTRRYSNYVHVSAIYRGMTTFIKEFKRLGYTNEMLSDWVNDMNQ